VIHPRARAQTNGRPANWVNSMFVQSIVDSFTQFGIENGLDELDWKVQFQDGDIYIHGTPPEERVRPIDLCIEWANAMGMTEYLLDAGESRSTWYVYDSPWLIEINAEQR
jgi:hypothetical protein